MTPTAEQAAVWLLESVTLEYGATVLSADDKTVRARFKSVHDASSWVGNYTSDDGALFETTPITMADPVVMLLDVAKYAAMF